MVIRKGSLRKIGGVEDPKGAAPDSINSFVGVFLLFPVRRRWRLR